MENYFVNKCKLLEKKVDSLNYITYIFLNLFPVSNRDLFIMCTQFPNWDLGVINIGDIGYINFKENIAGMSTWYNKEEGNKVCYKYDSIQLIKFIPEICDGNLEITL